MPSISSSFLFRCALSLLSVLVGCSSTQPRATLLPSGDSIIILGSGPAIVPNSPKGLFVEFYPFITLRDRTRLRAEALQLWDMIRPHTESLGTPFVVLRPTTNTPWVAGFRQAQTFGFVFEQRPDHRWYFLHDSVTVDTYR